VVAREPGYLIRVQPPELDVAVFEALCHDAGTALRAGEWADASSHAAQALGLWRGAPLIDVSSQPLHDPIVSRLEQLRLQALEDSAQAGLHLGHHDRVVPQLRDLSADHPLRERFHAQLMVALVCSGRQAEALAAYQHARRELVSELGIEPGPELRDLHERILAGDTILLTPPRSEGVSWPPDTRRHLPAEAVVQEPTSPSATDNPVPVVPRELPAATYGAVGTMLVVVTWIVAVGFVVFGGALLGEQCRRDSLGE
jgi:hypothetical protein